MNHYHSHYYFTRTIHNINESLQLTLPRRRRHRKTVALLMEKLNVEKVIT